MTALMWPQSKTDTLIGSFFGGLGGRYLQQANTIYFGSLIVTETRKLSNENI